MKPMFTLIATVSLLSQIMSCNKKTPLGPQGINNTLFFLIKKNNQRLPDSVLNATKLSYFENGIKQYQSDLSRGINEGGFYAADLGILTTRNTGAISSDKAIKDYFLEYPDGTKDTLFIDYRNVSYEEAKSNSCYCYRPLVGLRYNGQTPIKDASINQAEVYVFSRR